MPLSPEALAVILEQFRDNWNKIYEELEKLRTRTYQCQQRTNIRIASKEGKCHSFECFSVSCAVQISRL